MCIFFSYLNFILPTTCNTLLADIYLRSDSFHYLYAYNSEGTDLEIEMFVKSFTFIGSNNPWAKGGLMIRESLDANSRYFGVFVSGSKGLVAQHRLDTGGITDTARKVSDARNHNIWLKITKIGNEFQAYYKTSANANWSTVGAKHTNTNFPSAKSFHHGIAVTSNDNTWHQATATLKCINWTATRSSPSAKVRFLILFHLTFSLFSRL